MKIGPLGDRPLRFSWPHSSTSAVGSEPLQSTCNMTGHQSTPMAPAFTPVHRKISSLPTIRSAKNQLYLSEPHHYPFHATRSQKWWPLLNPSLPSPPPSMSSIYALTQSASHHDHGHDPTFSWTSTRLPGHVSWSRLFATIPFICNQIHL